LKDHPARRLRCAFLAADKRELDPAGQRPVEVSGESPPKRTSARSVWSTTHGIEPLPWIVAD
jgi:hypothetical protein